MIMKQEKANGVPLTMSSMSRGKRTIAVASRLICHSSSVLWLVKR